MDIGSLFGTLDIQDNLSSKLDSAAQRVIAFGQKHDEVTKKVTEGFGSASEAAESFSKRLDAAVQNPIQAIEDLAKSIGSTLVSGMKAVGPEAEAVTLTFVGLGVAVTAVAGAVFALADKAAKSGEEVLSFSRKTGIAVENVGALEFATKAAGGSLDSLTTLLRMVEMRGQAAGAETGKFANALADIGINSASFNKMDSESKILALAVGFQKGAKSGNDMADAMAIMGRAGVSQLDMLYKLNPELIKLGESLGVTWSPERVKQAEEFRVELGIVETALGNIAVKIGMQVLPVVEDLMKKFVSSPANMDSFLQGINTLAHSLGLMAIAAGDATVGTLKLVQATLNLASLPLGAVNTIDKSVLKALQDDPKLFGNAGPGMVTKLTEEISRSNATLAAGKVIYDQLGSATDFVYNTTQKLGKALTDVHIAGETANVTNTGLNKAMQNIAEVAPKASEAIDPFTKKVNELFTQMFGEKAQFDADAMEVALEAYRKNGLTPTAEQLDAVAKKTAAWAAAGATLGPMLDIVNERAIKWQDNLKGIAVWWDDMLNGAADGPMIWDENSVSAMAWLNAYMAGLDRIDANKAMQRQIDEIHAIGDGLQQIGQQMGGFTGQAVSGLGAVVNAWGAMQERILKTGSAALTAAQQIGNVMQGIASIVGATSNTGGTTNQNRRADVVGGAAAGASAGAIIGMNAAPLTFGLSIAVGALAGAVVGWVRAAHSASEEAKKLDAQLTDLHGTVDTTYGSFANATAIAQRYANIGVGLADATGSTGHHSTEDLARVQAQLDNLDATLKAVASDAQKYGLAWSDMDLVDGTAEATKASDALVLSFTRLKDAGYDSDAIVRGMSGDLNTWLSNALKAHAGISASMAPLIENLIRTHQLTEDNARAMLGLAADTTPSLQDITDAAGRYGLKLDELDGKVPQLSIDSQAAQIVTDFNTLTSAGVSFGVMMTDHTDDATGAVTGMHHSLQDLVTQALTTGSQVPLNLKPILQQMIDVGGPDGLTDQFGNKLTDLSGVTFEGKPLSQSIDDLITALDNLITKITGKGGLNDAINGVPPFPSDLTTGLGTGPGGFVTTPPLGTASTPQPGGTGTHPVILTMDGTEMARGLLNPFATQAQQARITFV